MKRKGVDYYPVIMRYATVKRELAQHSFMVTYMYNLSKTFLGKWFTPPPGKNCPYAHLYSDFDAESGEQRD